MAWIILLLAAAGLALFLLRNKKAPGRSSLRKKCLHEFRLPPAEAEKALERHLETLREKHPGKDEDWYYEKILYDLGRDRR